MTGLVLVAIYLTVGIAGLLLAAGRPLASAVALLVGVGWPVTLASTIPGRHQLWAGAVLVVAVLLFLLLTREGRRPLRRLWPALAAVGALVLVGVGASTTTAVAKEQFLGWQAWNYNPDPDAVGVRYVWSSNYTGIKFPKEPTVVLRIEAPKRNLYWRATTLERVHRGGLERGSEPGAGRDRAPCHHPRRRVADSGGGVRPEELDPAGGARRGTCRHPPHRGGAADAGRVRRAAGDAVRVGRGRTGARWARISAELRRAQLCAARRAGRARRALCALSGRDRPVPRGHPRRPVPGLRGAGA